MVSLLDSLLWVLPPPIQCAHVSQIHLLKCPVLYISPLSKTQKSYDFCYLEIEVQKQLIKALYSSQCFQSWAVMTCPGGILSCFQELLILHQPVMVPWWKDDKNHGKPKVPILSWELSLSVLMCDNFLDWILGGRSECPTPNSVLYFLWPPSCANHPIAYIQGRSLRKITGAFLSLLASPSPAIGIYYNHFLAQLTCLPKLAPSLPHSKDFSI